MPITRAQIEARLKQLRLERDQAVANVHAFEGAIQDCEHWLREVEKDEETPCTSPATP